MMLMKSKNQNTDLNASSDAEKASDNHRWSARLPTIHTPSFATTKSPCADASENKGATTNRWSIPTMQIPSLSGKKTTLPQDEDGSAAAVVAAKSAATIVTADSEVSPHPDSKGTTKNYRWSISTMQMPSLSGNMNVAVFPQDADGSSAVAKDSATLVTPDSEVSANPDSKDTAKNRWSIATMQMPSLSSKNTALPQDEGLEAVAKDAAIVTPDKPASKRLFFSNQNMSSKQTAPPIKVNAVAAHQDAATAARWSIPSISTALGVPTKETTNTNLVVVRGNEMDEKKDTYEAIHQVEFRGVTVRQLKDLVQIVVQHQCVLEQWKSTDNGRPLQPRNVTMYDLVKYHILPITQAHGCSYVEQAYGKHHYENAMTRPPQFFVSHTWSDSVMDLFECIQQHASDRGLDTENEDTYWICALAMNQHSIASHSFIGDADTLDQAALQNPMTTERILKATQGCLCVVDKKNTYFTRMWCLWELYLAIERTKESPCLYAEEEDRFILDLYATNEDGKPVGLTDGPAQVDKFRPTGQKAIDDEEEERNILRTAVKDGARPRNQYCNRLEWSELRSLRQSQFRFQMFLDALAIHLESTYASIEDDTRRIMNCIIRHSEKCSNPGAPSAYDGEALTVHPAYSKVNALIQGTIAGLGYRCALEDAKGEKGGELEQTHLARVQAALQASPIESLEVTFAGCSAFKIREALKFVESLPASLRCLDLDYSYLDFQYGEEFAIGFGRLSENLEVFSLNCGFCSNLENLDRLWEELGKLNNLRHLVLVIHPNKNMTSVDGLADAICNMPKLEKLELEFDCFGEYSKMVAMAKGGATLNSISSKYRSMLGKSSESLRRTEELSQQFDRVTKLATMDLNGAYISDSSIQRLCRSLKSRAHDTKLTVLKLRFLGDLGKKLKSVENLDDLRATLEGVRKSLKLFS